MHRFGWLVATPWNFLMVFFGWREPPPDPPRDRRRLSDIFNP